MKGWLFKKIHAPLELVEREDPKPQEGQIAIKIKAAGLCHSDVGLMEGITTSQLAYYPIIIGHEFAGVVSEVGKGVKDFKVGDKVACRAGFGSPGVSMEGAYSTMTVAPAQFCTKVPDGVTWAEAAAATDAGLTSYHAIAKTAGIKKGDKVGIVGVGGLGWNAVQIAIALGAKVYASTRKKEVQEKAKEIGCVKVVSDIRELKDEHLNTIVDFAGFDTTLQGSLETINHGGTIVIIGLGGANWNLNITQLVCSEVNIKTSIGGDVDDLKNVLQLIKEKKLSIPALPITFDEIPDGLEKLKQGKVVGRLVALLD